MSFQLADAHVTLRADDAPLMAGLGRVRGSVAATYGQMLRLSAASNNLFSIIGLGSLGLSLAEIIQSGAQSTREMNKLRAVLRASGQEAEDNAGSIEDFANGLSEATAVSAGLVKTLATTALQAGITVDEVKNLVTAAVGLRDVFGSEEAALDALIKARHGNLKAMEKSIPSLKGLSSAEEKMARVVELANQGLKVQEEISHDAIGSTERLKNSAGDLAETMGGALAPALITVTQAASEFFKTLTVGTKENETYVLDLTIQMLEWEKLFASTELAARKLQDVLTNFGKESEGTKAQRQEVERLKKSLEEAWAQRKGAAAAEAAEAEKAKEVGDIKTDAVEKENKAREKQLKLLTRIEDVWARAQEEAISGARVGAASARSLTDPSVPIPGARGKGRGSPGTPTPPPPPSGPPSSTGEPPATGGAPGGGTLHGGPGEVRDRDWHRKNADRLKMWLESAKRARHYGQVDPNNGRFADRIRNAQKELRDSSDIAEFGSTTEAGRKRDDQRDREGLAKRKTQRASTERERYLRERKAAEESVQDSSQFEKGGTVHTKLEEMRARAIAEAEAKHKTRLGQIGEMDTLDEERTRGRMRGRKDYAAPRDRAERDNLNKPRDIDAENLRKGLQNKLDLPMKGGALYVEDKHSERLVKALEGLEKVIGAGGQGGTFGDN